MPKDKSGKAGSEDKVLLPAPKAPAVSPYQQIQGQSELYRGAGIVSSNPEEVQANIRGLDSILLDLSKLQALVGHYRKELGAHIQKLRQANPQGKPAEGTVRKLSNGTTVIFVGKAWAPYTGDPPPAKEETGEP